MRCFIAIEFKGRELERLRDNFDLSGIKTADSFHLTLNFLGDITEDKAEIVKERLNKLKFKGFKVKLDKIGCFPSEKRISVIWVSLKPDMEIINLKEKIDNLLEGIFDKEERFKAHITLGRVKFIQDKEKLKEKLNIKVNEEEYEINEIKLFRSELTREGARYTELFSVKAD